MKVAHGTGTWLRRALVAVVLAGVAVMPARASSQPAQHCTGHRCTAPGSVLWKAALPGRWLAQQGEGGTVASQGAAYAAAGGGLAVVAQGTTVTARSAATGALAWQVPLTGVPPGSAVAGVRAFPGVVAVGVQLPGARSGRDEVILSGQAGQQLRVYPAAPYGGAVTADAARAVVVADAAVRAYDNSTGKLEWSRAVAPGAQGWQVSGSYLYVPGPGSGAAAPTVALRRIDLRTGSERLVRPAGAAAFTGKLAAVTGGAAVFSGPAGVVAYSLPGGQRLWSVPGAVLELADDAGGTVYLAKGSSLEGLRAATGQLVSRGALSVAGSLYYVSGGVALGLDENGLGDAWGYDLGSRQVVWTSAALPWPHFFVDLSGLGGSASPGGHVVLLATCGKAGRPAGAGGGTAAPACARPQLAAVLL